MIVEIRPMTADEWKQENIDGKLREVFGWELLIERATGPHKLNMQEFRRQTLAEIARLEALDYSQFECRPNVVQRKMAELL
jgi:hypothetical protein